jgi:hypothetical protein
MFHDLGLVAAVGHLLGVLLLDVEEVLVQQQIAVLQFAPLALLRAHAKPPVVGRAELEHQVESSFPPKVNDGLDCVRNDVQLCSQAGLYQLRWLIR